MPGRLTPQQVQHYNDEGYLLYHQPVFTPAKFDALKEHFEELLAGWSQRSNGRPPDEMDTPHFYDPTLFEWLLDDSVLDIVESLIGPDIALWSSHFLCKPPGVGRRVPWHEDSAYWNGRLVPMNVVTVWLAIDPANVANGCMKLIPRTHHHGYSEYEPVSDPTKQVFPIEIKHGLVDESKAVDCVLEPNQCSLHHAKMVHGSGANTGTVRRCGYTMRFMPTTTKFVEASDGNETFQIYLARGRDRAGNHYGDPMKPNETWLKQHPQFRLPAAVR